MCWKQGNGKKRKVEIRDYRYMDFMKLTRKVHATDFTNASRTLLFDIREKKWSEELCEILGIPMNILPEVYPSAYLYGSTYNCPGLPDGISIGGIAGDQQAAMVGQNCISPGRAKNTYGTGCFMLLNNGEDFTISTNGLLTTLTLTITETLYMLLKDLFLSAGQ